MGDRANIIMEGETDAFPHPVFFYTHWRGSDVKEILQRALEKGKSRWNDPAYLARVIFCELVAGQEKEITGFGISGVYGDGGNDLYVNTDLQTVRDIHDRQWNFNEFLAEKF